jgi:hypothetical protein
MYLDTQTKGKTMATQFKSLDELFEAVQNNTFDGDYQDMPTFGGDDDCPWGVFSWDKTRFLVQSHNGWKLINRTEN